MAQSTMGTLAMSVADEVLRWFRASAECQKKVPPSHWTVLAGIVVVSQSTANDSEASMLRVLAAATGNKCLGRRDLHANGLVVNDCHAEILARRALLRYLYTEALAWTAGREDSEASLFERHPVTQRLQLKEQHSLHLYISEAPCGDAAIYQLRDDAVDELVKQRVERTVDVSSSHEVGAVTGVQQRKDEERSAFRLTGAKAKRKRDEPFTSHNGNRDSVGEHQEQHPSQEKRFDQMTGIARVKSGRSDLPPDKQTLSMSCSDKLAKWNALGIQGTLLLQFYEPLFLNSIVVSADDVGISMAAQQEALERAVSGRLERRMDGDNDSAAEIKSSCEFHIVAHERGSEFEHKRTKERTASSFALNWTCREAHWREPPDSNSNAVTKAPRHTMLLRFFQNADVEVLVAATGLKQGAKKVAKMSLSETQKVASRLAKWTLFLAFERVLSVTTKSSSSNGSDATSHNSEETQPMSLSYQQQKEAIPVQRHGVSSESSQATGESVQQVRGRKRAFLTAIETWIGVPYSFKQFTVDSQ